METLETKHTPGPWQPWNKHGNRIMQRWRVCTWERTPGVGTPIAAIDNENLPPAEQYANACLIGASPELLQQLNAFVEFANEWFGDKMPEDWKGRCICANAAINKSLGQ